MLIPKKLSSIKKSALGFAFILLLLVIVYLVYVNFLADKIEIVKPLKIDVDTLAVPKIDPNMNDDFLNKSPYRDLKTDIDLEITAGKMGRPNPFQPIPFYFRNSQEEGEGTIE